MIEIKDVHFTYPNGTKALRGINLSINSGEMVALMGSNGSGKTTLIKHIIGLLKPTNGDVIVNGMNTKEVAIADLAHCVGYVTQDPDTQIFEKTVYREVEFAPKNLGFPKDEIRKNVERELKRFEVYQYRHSLPLALSGGERKLVVYASTTVTNPKVLLLDEPTRGLDYRRKISLVKNMRIFQNKGSAVLFVTHDLEFVAENIDRVIVLNEGQVVIDDEKCAVFSQQDKIKEGGLVVPQILRLSQELAKLKLPSCLLTVEEFCDKFMERVK